MSQQQRGEERRQQILDAADRLFRSQGYSATSMRQIAAEAGFGRAVSGLYNHYASKEAIFAALLAARSPYEELLDALGAVEGETLEAYLLNWLRAIWPVMQHHLGFVQLVMIDVQEFDGATLATFLQDLLPHYFTLFGRILSLPDVRDDLPPPVIFRTIASVMIGSVFTEMVVRQGGLAQVAAPLALDDAWLQGMASVLAHGMSKPGASHTEA